MVTKVSPTRIGYGGGVVTIHGDGFSEDVFNQFDPILGNKVSIVFGYFVVSWSHMTTSTKNYFGVFLKIVTKI